MFKPELGCYLATKHMKALPLLPTSAPCMQFVMRFTGDEETRMQSRKWNKRMKF
jgi:hypothetical protein